MILGKKVLCSIPEKKNWVRGVLSGIPTDISAESIKESISGAAVKEVRRLHYVKDKEREGKPISDDSI